MMATPGHTGVAVHLIRKRWKNEESNTSQHDHHADRDGIGFHG